MPRASHTSWAISALIEAAFAEQQDEDNFAPCPATVELNRRGTREVLDAALTLTRSIDPAWRDLAAHLLGQLGQPERTFPEECCDALIELLDDPAEEVVAGALYALGHLGNHRADAAVLRHATHDSAYVRRGVGFALAGTNLPEVVPVLIGLMQDEHSGTRDWATTTLAATDFDTPAIRDALFTRATTDSDAMTRGEALHGLTRRGDIRAVAPLIAELQGEKPHLFEDAAYTWLGIDPDEKVSPATLIEGLRAHRH